MCQEDHVDALVFADEVTSATEESGWKILIVDDEPEMHTVTRLTLGTLRFRDRPLLFLSAHSAREARELLARHPDFALILLDVVMETEDAGLRLARYIRGTLGNDRVRIVLRTGQPGQAPERNVVIEYDINDYKEKTELTAQRLVTTVLSSLRAYQAIEEAALLNIQLEQRVADRTAELERSNALLKHSLHALEEGERAGRRVQFKLLPPPSQTFGDCRFSHFFLPSEFMSGDFLDYLAVDEHRVLFYVADISGHGVASAFVTVFLKRFVSAYLDAQLRAGNTEPLSPARLLGSLNQELLREGMGKHAALFLGLLDTRSHQLLYANAGAYPYPLLLAAQGNRFLETPSTPAGLLDEAAYTDLSTSLPEVCSLVLASDGLLEVLPGEHNAEKLARLVEVAQQGFADAADLARNLGIDRASHPPDDLTVMVVRCGAPA